jgi:hypothetical protein
MLTKNIIVTDNDLSEMVFVQDWDGGIDDIIHTNNCFWDVDDGKVELGVTWGPGEIAANPLFVDFNGGDYHLLPASPALGWGAVSD